MRSLFSIGRVDTFTQSGELDTTVFEVRAALDDDWQQELTLEHPEDLISLRDVLDQYIKTNNLNTATES